MAQQSAKKTEDDDVEKSVSKLRNTASRAANQGAEIADLAYDELREQFQALQADFAELSENLAKAGQQKAKDAAGAARKTTRRAAAKASEGIDYAADQVETVLEDAEEFARQRPALTLGLAAGAGFLLALAMSRR